MWTSLEVIILLTSLYQGMKSAMKKNSKVRATKELWVAYSFISALMGISEMPN